MTLHKSISFHYRENDDVWRLHGILCGQDDPAVVDAALEVRVLGPSDGEVPLEEVVLQGARVVLGGRLGQLLGLAHQTLHG